MVPEVEVVSVVKDYGPIRALDGVSFAVKNGEYFVVLGPTGAGKTTLLKVIAGLLHPTKGRVLIDGEDVTEVPPEQRNISYMPQGYALFPHMTVWENVSFGAEARGAGEDVVREVLEIVGLYHRRHSLPSQLSGGQQQRVALARALASGSNLVLLDEPLSALDLLLNIELRYELKRLARRLGITVIHVTHNYEEALSIADRLLVLRRGRVVQIGSPEEVYVRPSTLFTANFLGEINILEGHLRGSEGDYSRIEIPRLGEILVSKVEISRGPVVVAYRPEDLKISESQRLKVNVFPCKIVNVEFHGLRHRIYAQLPNSQVVKVDAWFSSGLGLRGDAVTVHLPPERALVYPYPRGGLIDAISTE